MISCGFMGYNQNTSDLGELVPFFMGTLIIRGDIDVKSMSCGVQDLRAE